MSRRSKLIIRFVVEVVTAFLLSATIAQADPISAAIITAFHFVGIAATIVKVAVFATAVLGLNALSKIATKNKTAGSQGIKQSTSTGGSTPRTGMFGLWASAGQLVAPPYTYGTDGKTPNAYLVYVIELGGIPGQQFSRLILNDNYVPVADTTSTIGGSASQGFAIGGEYAGNAWVRYHDGTQTSVDSFLLSKLAADPLRPWSSTMVGKGCPYIILVFKYNPDVFTGFPSVRVECTGIPLYDPRKDSTVAGGSGAHRWGVASTYETTRNPAQIIYNIHRGITLPDGSVWGGECDAEDLPLDNWFTGMNECDLLIDKEGGGQVKQFECGYEFSVSQEPATVINDLEACCLGQQVEFGGVWKIRCGGPGLPVMSITDDDYLVDHDQDHDLFTAIDQANNGVQGTYSDPSALWGKKEAPARYNPDLEIEDGKRLIESVDLPNVYEGNQVQRIMEAAIKEERRFRRHSLSLPPYCSALETLDCISWTSVREGYTDKSFEVSSLSESFFTLNIAVALRERDSSDIDWDPIQELPTVPSTPGKVIPEVQTVPGWTVTGSYITDNDLQQRRPAILIEWDGADMPDVKGLKYWVRLTDTEQVVGQGYIADIASSALRIVAGVLADEDYQVQGELDVERPTEKTLWTDCHTPLILIDSIDIADAAIIARTIADGAINTAKFAAGITAPTIENTLPTTGNFDGRIVFLTTDKKLYRYNATTGTFIATTAAADLTGTIVASQIADATITVNKFASGIAPPTIVSTLPTTGNYEGRLVVLTTDGQLYRYHGSSFTKAVAAGDLTGQITATQITDGSISTPKLAAGAVTANEIAANTITAAKIASDTITAAQIAAGAIGVSELAAGSVTASKLFVGQANLFGDSYTQDSAWWSSQPNSPLPAGYNEGNWIIAGPDATSTTMGSSKYWGCNSVASGIAKNIISPTIYGMEAAKVYEIKATGYNNSNRVLTINVQYFDYLGNNTGGDLVATWSNGQSGVKSTQVTAPANTVGYRIYFNCSSGVSVMTGAVLVSNVIVRLAAEATLIVDGSIIATKIAAGTITAAQIAAGTITAANIAADTITAGQIAVGAIGASEIAAGAVTAEKLTVASFDNLIRNGDMASGTLSAFSRIVITSGSNITALSGFAGPSKYGLYLARGTTVGELSVCLDSTSWDDTTMAGGVTTVINDEFYFECIVYQTTVDVTKFQSLVRINSGGGVGFCASGAETNTTSDGIVLYCHGATTSFNKYSGYFKNTVGPGKFYLQVFQDANAASGTQSIIYNMILRRKNTAQLIVDGTVTATKIQALTITAANIAANTLTADKLSIASLSAITADLGTVTAGYFSAGKIGISSGMSFVDTTQNTVPLRSTALAQNMWDTLTFTSLSNRIVPLAASGTAYCVLVLQGYVGTLSNDPSGLNTTPYRVRTGSVRFKVRASALVYGHLSLWYKKNASSNNGWTYLTKVTNTWTDDMAMYVEWSGDLTVAANDYFQFAVGICDSTGAVRNGTFLNFSGAQCTVEAINW